MPLPDERPPPQGNAGRQPGAFQSNLTTTKPTATPRDPQSLNTAAAEMPEHRNDRRRFLVWALMIGAVPPERVVERVLSEIEGTP